MHSIFPTMVVKTDFKKMRRVSVRMSVRSMETVRSPEEQQASPPWSGDGDRPCDRRRFFFMWGNTHNVYHCNHCPSIVGRHHGSPVYSCHLLSIHAASLRSISFLYFTEPIFAWHVPLVSLIFLKRCLVFPSSELNWTEHHGSCVTLLWVVLRCQCLESWWLQPLWASKPKDKTVTGGPPQNSATKGTFHEQLSCLTVSSLVSKFHAGVRISTYLSSDNEERISVARSTSGCEDQMCFNLR